MKNLILCQHLRKEIPCLHGDVSQCCVDATEGDVYFNCGGYVYKVSTSFDNVQEYTNLNTYYEESITPVVTDISFVNSALCAALQNGDILSIEPGNTAIECVGFVDTGLKVVKWSPTESLVALVTGQDMVLVMSSTFDPVAEVSLHQENFGEKQFVTVGWGKKETQFHGSEGKNARTVTTTVEPAPEHDNRKPIISWRDDGELFAVNTVSPISKARHLRIFSSEGALCYTSEPVSGIEAVLAWRPGAPNQMATTQCLPNKYVVAFFEKNGLRHGEFKLPFSRAECRVHRLAWNCEGTILAVWCEVGEADLLQLWTTGNYHWYLKRSLRFAEGGRLLEFQWDLALGHRMHLVCEKSCYWRYDWDWEITRSSGLTDGDQGTVAVQDGVDVLLTSFRRVIVPPPMSEHTIQLSVPADTILFGPNPNRLCVVLCDGQLSMYSLDRTSSLLWTTPVTWQVDPVGPLCHWVWLKDSLMVCCAQQQLVVLSVGMEDGSVVARMTVPLEAAVVRLAPLPKERGALMQLENGRLLMWKPEEHPTQHGNLPELCSQLAVCQVDGKDVVFALSRRRRFYVDGQEVANNVTSFMVHLEYLLLTTLQHVLLCVRLTAEGLRSLKTGEAAQHNRRIERGARLVTAIGSRVVLQMPRGNLETIYPRSLTIHEAGKLFDESRYREAFELLRRHRINLNLLHDHSPEKFALRVDRIIDDIRNPSWLSLFLLELSNEDVTRTLYSSHYGQQQDGTQYADKVSRVCIMVRRALCARDDAELYLLPELVTFIQPKEESGLESALRRVQEVRRNEEGGNKLPVTSDEALRYLLYLVDVQELYDAALGLYDFDLVILVAAKSQKDPKEYLPFLNELRRLEPEYRKFVIDRHLRRHQSALNHAVNLSDDKFEEVLSLVEAQSLYSQALRLFPRDSTQYRQVASVYAKQLLKQRKYDEAAVMLERCGDLQGSLNALKEVGDWRSVFTKASQLGCNKAQYTTLGQEMAEMFTERRDFLSAADVLLHLDNVEEGVAALCQGQAWAQALWTAERNDRRDLVETQVIPGAQQHLDQLLSHLEQGRQQFQAYKSRLLTVRTNKQAQLLDGDGDGDAGPDCDLYSDTSSVAASFRSGSRLSSRSGRSSSRSRRKQERKMLSLREGSPYEDLALVRVLHELVSNTFQLRHEVHQLCRILLRFEHDAGAAALQSRLAELIAEMEVGKAEIWTVELQGARESFGPDATVNSITMNKQLETQPDANIVLLEPHLRFSPPAVKDDSWKISILSI